MADEDATNKDTANKDTANKDTANKDTANKDTINILGKEDFSDARGNLIKLSDYLYEKRDVPADTVGQQFQRFLRSMQKIVQNAPDDFGKFELDSITLTAEVSAKGSISLVGGAELAGKGGITITLKKPTPTTPK